MRGTLHDPKILNRAALMIWISLLLGSVVSSITYAPGGGPICGSGGGCVFGTCIQAGYRCAPVSGSCPAPRSSYGCVPNGGVSSTTTVGGPGLSTTTVTGSGSSGPSTVSGAVIAQVCTLYNTIHQVIFVIGLILIIIGAALYASAHVLPGNLKSNAQGYGMGMIVGGVVGVILALSAPFILGVITGNFNIAVQCGAYTAF